MKNFLFRRIFSKEINRMYDKCEIEKNKMIAEINGIREQKIQDKYAIIKRIFQFFNNSEIVGIDKNKVNEEVLIVKCIDDFNFNIYIFGDSYKAINGLPRIMASIYSDYQTKEKYIKIHDIQIIDKEIGNGSIAMKYFLMIAKEIRANYIIGNISNVDFDHFDRLEHFYKKFDFEVSFYNGRTSGKIKKILI